MNHIGSQFYKDMSTYDKSKNKVRRAIMNISVILAVVVGAAMMYFKFPDLLMYVSVAIVASPGVIIGMKKDLDMKEKWRYSLEMQERIYQTEETEVYQTNDFIQEKNISEVTSIQNPPKTKRRWGFKSKKA